MKFITEVFDQAEVLTEQVDGKKKFFIEGIFMQSEIKNKNGRIYPRAVMENEVNRYMTAKVGNKTAYGELGHPTGPTINPERVSHLIESLHWDGNNVIGKARVLDTPYGLIAQEMMNGGGRLGVSSRGLGSLKENNGVMEVQSDFYIATAADIVTDPSAPDAMVRMVNENIDWIMEDGVWTPREREENIKTLAKMGKEKEAALLSIFESFLAKLKV